LFTRKIRTGIAISLVLACIVIIATTLYADIPRTTVALAHFRWSYLPLILGLTLCNYLGRFGKWQYYLKLLKIKLPWTTSLLIFLSGLSMAITPGKLGELLKSYLLKYTTDAPISRTSPIIVSERLTDGIAMVLLASTGLVLFRFGWEMLLVLLLVSLTGVMIIQNRTIAFAILNFGTRQPLLSRIAHILRTFYESAYTLLQWRSLILAIGIGMCSWLGECGALYFVYTGLGLNGSFDLFIKATFILAISSLVGSATGLPGGLGTADGSILGLSRLLVSPSATIGGAATLLIRFCTLWFGLFIGVIALLVFRLRRHADPSAVQSFHWEQQDISSNALPPVRRQRIHIVSTPANTGEKTL
jgi:uncharacterized protein (TIRG00374 family)